MKKYFLLKVLTICLLCCSCRQNYYIKESEKQVVLQIDSISISYNELDVMVRQELFDELNRIYGIRKIATKVLVKNKLLALEAQKNKVSKVKLLENLFERKITDSLLMRFIKINAYHDGVSSLERGLNNYDPESDKGKQLIEKRLKNKVLKDYVDSLKTVYDIKLFLKPPTPPVIEIKNLMTHYKGNLDAKVTFLQISDLECSMCREYAPIFESLYEKYKDQVRFGFTQFGSYTSISAIATEAAANQGKFWQMHDSIAFCKELPETEDIYNIAASLDFDMEQFGYDFTGKIIPNALEENFEKLDAAGIYGTPTIMINNRLIYNSSSLMEMEDFLIEEIAKSK